MMDIRHTYRVCSCINEPVELTARVVVVIPGPLEPEKIVGVDKWLNCNKKNSCGKKCNYFYLPPNCNACDERDLRRF